MHTLNLITQKKGRKSNISFFLFLSWCLLINAGCATSSKQYLEVSSLTKDDLINYCIDRFCQKKGLLRPFTVFSVKYHDTVYRKPDPNTVEAREDGLISMPNLSAVEIIGWKNPFQLAVQPRYSKNSNYPSQTVEQSGKLFFWYDPDVPFTDSAMALLRKYDLTFMIDVPIEKIRERPRDISSKTVKFYFCKRTIPAIKMIINERGVNSPPASVLRCP